MNLKPQTQNILYEHGKVFQNITNLFDSNKLPNKILLSGVKGSGKATLAYHLINYIFSKNEKNTYNKNTKTINKDNRSFKLLLNGSHPNFYLVDLFDEKKSIEISQIRKMINYTNKSSFNNLPKLVLIDNVENLNLNSGNSLLKILEEPNENVYFMLIYNNSKKILKTLKSRCINFNINLSFESSINITHKILGKNPLDLINNDLINYYNSPGHLLNFINFANNNKIDLKEYNLKNFLSFLIEKNHYKKNEFIKLSIFNFIEHYFLKTFMITNNKNKHLILYSRFIKKIDNTIRFNLDLETLFMEFKSKILNV